MLKYKLIIMLIAITLPLPNYNIQAPKPDALPAAEAPTPVSSTILLPIKINSASIQQRIESSTPLTFSGGEHATFEGKISFDYDTKFKIDRGPIKLGLSEKNISLSTSLSGSGDVVVPTQGLIPRTTVSLDLAADIGVLSLIHIKPDWVISSSTTTSLKVTKATTRILGLPVNVIDAVEGALRPKMRELAEEVTAGLDATDIRSPVEEFWKQLGQPISVDKANNGWLSFKPSGLYFSGFTDTYSGISAVFGVETAIAGSYGSRPVDIDTGSLPPFNSISPVSSGFNINLPVFAGYSYLQESLKKETVGKSYELDNGIKVEIKNVALYTNGEKVVLMLDIKAKLPGKWFSTSGRIYFAGKPVFDGVNNHLSMQDFDYDLKTKNYLLEAANGLFHESLRSQIANKLSWDLAPQLHEAKIKANENLVNVPLKNGASLQGSVSTMKVNGVYPLSTGIQIGAVFKGDISVEF